MLITAIDEQTNKQLADFLGEVLKENRIEYSSVEVYLTEFNRFHACIETEKGDHIKLSWGAKFSLGQEAKSIAQKVLTTYLKMENGEADYLDDNDRKLKKEENIILAKKSKLQLFSRRKTKRAGKI